MKNYCPKGLNPLRSTSDLLGFLTALTTILLATPSIAADRNITDINVEKTHNRLELKLTTDKKASSNSSFFTVRKGNTIEANLLNTDLNLPTGDYFKKENPLPGIKTIEIDRVDREHLKILISTKSNTSIEHLLEEKGSDLILSLNRVTKTQSFQREVKKLSHKAVSNIKQTYKTALEPKKTKDDKKPVLASSKDKTSNSDVLIPNPEVIINDSRANAAGEKIFQAQDSVSETTLPRAVAPPVGDMAVSNISTMPDTIDLGSRALVPRLVLRDAPVREVLSLLARSANLNVVFATNDEKQGNNKEENGPTISLDLENQPVQEVFNSVLLVSGLNANRRGNLIYVGEKLPAQARNLISRTIRLNQVTAENAALFLASQGANGKRLTNEVEEILDPETGKVIQRKETSPELNDLDGGSKDDTGTVPLMLRGLQVSTDGRLNAITLVGEPRRVEVATAMLTQLDARRRQVAVNVKVLDVNLINEDRFNSSFSFGVNDSFFIQDNGSAALRFGDSAPPTRGELNSSQGRVSNPPVINNPFAGANTFIDLNSSFGIPGTSPGLIDNGTLVQRQGTGQFFNRNAGVSSDPFAAGLTNFTRATFDEIENDDGTLTFTQGTEGTATSGLPSLFQFPDKFLAQLEAQVTNGNAKILTDPTLMVQEGQQASVKLTQTIISSIRTSIDNETGIRTNEPVFDDAGVVLSVDVERVDDNGFVSMSVTPRVTSVGTVVDFESSTGVTNPISLLTEREVNSGLVRLRDGQTLILSGIIQDQERTITSKVPVLGDIPLLGSLFRSTEKGTERAEVIVLLTPEIVEEDAGIASHFSPSKESREVLHREGVGLLGN